MRRHRFRLGHYNFVLAVGCALNLRFNLYARTRGFHFG